MGLINVLGVIFVVLKLTSVIDWSWWLVLLPFYGWAVLVLIVCAFAAIDASSK